MSDSPVYKRVQASDHLGGITVPVVDRAAPIADTQPVNDPVAIENGPLTEQPATAANNLPDSPAPDKPADRLEATLFRLRSSRAHLRHSSALLNELRETLTATMNAIRASQHRIAISDRVIARAQTLDCIEPQTADGD